MTWFLIVVFLGTNGPVIKDGWYPWQQPNQQVCEERAMKVVEFLFDTAEAGTFTVACVKIKRGMIV